MALNYLARLLIVCGLLLSACGPTDPNEQFIQGPWLAAGDLGEGHSWYLKWTFTKGQFEVEGYPPLQQSGKYQVTASEGDTLTLALNEQQGDWGSADDTMIVVIDQANGTLTIDGQGPFSRTE